MKFFHQLQSSDCAAACLAMLLSNYGKKCNIDQIKSYFEFTRSGVAIQDIEQVSGELGLDFHAYRISSSELKLFKDPIILHWRQEHFLILEKVKTTKKGNFYYIADPAYGRTKLDEETFNAEWKGIEEKGIGIHLRPRDDFFDVEIAESEKEKGIFGSVFFKEAISYIRQKKISYTVSILLVCIAIGSNWLAPFIFQRIIDNGIIAKNTKIIYVLLGVQLILFISSFLSDFISQFILTKMNFRLSISLRGNLLKKLMRLPLSYFDTRLNTETLQRLADQGRIQNFITWKSTELILNTLNILVFGGILFYFNKNVFVIYLILSIISIFWITFFLKKRKVLEYAMFLRQSQSNNSIYEFIMNMSEIKVNAAQNFMINKILNIQEKLNKIELNSLFLNVYQIIGVNFLSKLKEIIIIGICAFLIIDNKMSLGALMSVSYVVGQLSKPVQSLVSFIRDTQDTSIANKRIGEVYNVKDENIEKKDVDFCKIEKIELKNVYFKYAGSFNPLILKDVSLVIPKNSVTAIVGTSGSGKTTLLKLLLSYYNPTEGEIFVNNQNLYEMNTTHWRNLCGAVLQDGQIFSGSVAENIAFSEDEIDIENLKFASKMACMDEFVNKLPMGYSTKIGNVGVQLSGGQKQRLLIARAIYKNPQFLLLDEATSSLDAENERMIHNNLQTFFRGKTVVIIAHRLSTVKNADKIIVLKSGKIVEQGNHKELVTLRNEYYNLVKNQLELGI